MIFNDIKHSDHLDSMSRTPTRVAVAIFPSYDTTNPGSGPFDNVAAAPNSGEMKQISTARKKKTRGDLSEL